ncbi:MAG TPA: YbjN domain-containing protein [Acidimicrobiia bacterium]|nr:YbjN domain-containing protein [Acidimicrobiia bacterium]
MTIEPFDLDAAHELVAAHLEGPVAAEPYIQVVEYDPELRRWYVRFTCDGRDATTIYFDLHERTLRYEVYFLPEPPGNLLELYEFLLRRNHTMYGARFSLGPEGDVYLVGRVALEHLTVSELDRIIGVLYELVERWFQPVVRLAYGPRVVPVAENA